MWTTAIAALAAGIWVYLAAGRGGFWRLRRHPDARPAGTEPRVIAVVPARNEAAVIGEAVGSLLTQDYAGLVRVIVVDDHSSDGTSDAARRAAQARNAVGRLTIVNARPLPPGWSGKVWAMAEGIQAAASASPDYYLLTDADITHGPGNLRRLVDRAEEGKFDLVSLMATLRCESFGERLLIPAFVFFFFKLYPPSWTARRDRRTAGAAGGCMLIRRTALERIGGLAAIRGELIDDCSLASAVKSSGGRIWLDLGEDVKSIRPYDSFGVIWRMIARTAFTQLRYSPVLLAGTAAGMMLTYLAPPLLTLFASRPASILGTAAWAMMTVTYLPMLRFYRQPAFLAPLLPLVALFYLGATLDSARRHWAGRGGEWKGRVAAA